MTNGDRIASSRDSGVLMASSPVPDLPAGRLPLLLLLVPTAAPLCLPTAASAHAQMHAVQTVPAGWPLIPDGIEPGDRFRLLLVTSTFRGVSSTDVADYNAHVQMAANGQRKPAILRVPVRFPDLHRNAGRPGLQRHHRAARPVCWLGGDKVADDDADLYDKS